MLTTLKNLTHLAAKRSVFLGTSVVLVTTAYAAPKIASMLDLFSDPTGQVRTVSAAPADTSNPFFQSLGTNGRSCASCHAASDGWSVTPAHLQQRFVQTAGLDPVFRPVDGAACPSADTSSVFARASAYRMLLAKGLIRVSLPVPANAEFTVLSVTDPNTVNGTPCPQTTTQQLAMFRRPLPATNLKFLSGVMWDGRETVKGESIAMDLMQQAQDATAGHAEGTTALSDAQLAQIVAFESALTTAQASDEQAGALDAKGASGGPGALASRQFFIGINDPLGGNPTGAAFNPEVFTEFASWANLPGNDPTSETRRSIARGEEIFNSRPIVITGVAGINDQPGLSTVNGSCTTCHSTPNAGDHSVSLPINIGIGDYPATAPLDTSGLPVYTIACNATGETYTVTDPGRAMITGKCSDIGKMKGPILRGLSARAPYFHNGSAATLRDVVEFYNNRFNLNLTERDKQDLVHFLQAL